MPSISISQNLEAYRLLYEIEVCLRELVMNEFSKAAGPQWHSKRLPSDVSEAIKRAKSYEYSQKSIKFTSFPPIYYVDFPDLRKTIERTDNWNEVFKVIFGGNLKSLLSADLQAIEPVRNKVAHNRLVTEHEVETVRVFNQRLRNCVSSTVFDAYVHQPHTYRPIFHNFQLLQDEVVTLRDMARALSAPLPASVWAMVSNAWWFEEGYLGCTVGEIRAFYSFVEEYGRQPRSWGGGPALARWVQGRNMENLASSAITRCAEIAKRADAEVGQLA